MADPQLQAFMAGIRKMESGSYAGNYSARNSRSGAYGAYQFMPKYWDGMAKAAGLPNANVKDPAAQDYVAAYWFGKYYSQYQNWNLVAVAWHAGAGSVNKIVRGAGKPANQISVADIRDQMPGEERYASRVTADMHLVRGRMGGDADIAGGTPPPPGQPGVIIEGQGYVNMPGPAAATAEELARESAERHNANMPDASEVLFASMEGMSNAISGGQRADWRTPSSSGVGELQPLDPSKEELPDNKIKTRVE